MTKRVKRWFNTPFDLLDIIVIFAVFAFVAFIVNFINNNDNRCVNAGHSVEYCERGLN